MHLYHYAGNNPVKYTDPDGKSTEGAFISQFSSEALAVAAMAGIITPELASTVAGAVVLCVLLFEDRDSIKNALNKINEASTPTQQADSAKENIQRKIY